MCSEDPRIPARSILELSRMLHSHRPLPRGPLCVPYLSSFPPPVFLPYSSLSLSPPCKYAPPETHQDLYSCKEKRRLLQMLHTERDIIPFFRSLSLLSFSPFFLPISIFPPLFLFLYFISLPLYFEFTSSTPRNLS